MEKNLAIGEKVTVQAEVKQEFGDYVHIQVGSKVISVPKKELTK